MGGQTERSLFYTNLTGDSLLTENLLKLERTVSNNWERNIERNFKSNQNQYDGFKQSDLIVPVKEKISFVIQEVVVCTKTVTVKVILHVILFMSF